MNKKSKILALALSLSLSLSILSTSKIVLAEVEVGKQTGAAGEKLSVTDSLTFSFTQPETLEVIRMSDSDTINFGEASATGTTGPQSIQYRVKSSADYDIFTFADTNFFNGSNEIKVVDILQLKLSDTSNWEYLKVGEINKLSYCNGYDSSGSNIRMKTGMSGKVEQLEYRLTSTFGAPSTAGGESYQTNINILFQQL